MRMPAVMMRVVSSGRRRFVLHAHAAEMGRDGDGKVWDGERSQ